LICCLSSRGRRRSPSRRPTRPGSPWRPRPCGRAEQLGDVLDHLCVPHSAYTSAGKLVSSAPIRPCTAPGAGASGPASPAGSSVTTTCAVAQISKVSGCAGPPGRAKALVEPLVVQSRRCAASRRSAASRHRSRRPARVLRALGTQHHRDVGAQRMGDRLQVLPQPAVPSPVSGSGCSAVRRCAPEPRGPNTWRWMSNVLAGCGPAAWGTSARTSPRRPAAPDTPRPRMCRPPVR
jgi:hypothetical protein